MNLTMKLVALAFVAIFAMGVWFLVAGYVAPTLPSADAREVELKWAISGSAGSVAAAAVASPFLVVLFARRRWLAAMFVVVPLVVVHGPSNFSAVGAYLVVSYLLLLVGGSWLASRVLTPV